MKIQNRSKSFCLSGAMIFLYVVLIASAQDKYKTSGVPSYQDLRYKTDLEFAKMLKKEWMKVEMLPGLVMDKTPKPAVMPAAEINEEDIKEFESNLQVSRPVRELSFEPPPSHEPVENPFEYVITAPSPLVNIAEISFF